MASVAFKNLAPLLDRVLIQRIEPFAVSRGGIVIPERAREKVLQGTVVAVGPGQRSETGEFVPPAVSVGDKVLLPKFGGTKVELEDKNEYHLFKESDILAKFEG